MRWWTTATVGAACRSTPPTASTARPATSRTRTRSSPGRHPRGARAQLPVVVACPRTARMNRHSRSSRCLNCGDPPTRIADANLTRFMGCVKCPPRHAAARIRAAVTPGHSPSPGHFWASWRASRMCARIGAPDRAHRAPGRMPGARFFPGARLNFAAKPAAVRRRSAGIWCSATSAARAGHSRIGSCDAGGTRGRWTAGGGVVAGEPRRRLHCRNLPRSSHRDARHGRASGATWSSCSPDFGVRGVLDRFGQINQGGCSPPTVLLRRQAARFAAAHVRVLAQLARSSSWW